MPSNPHPEGMHRKPLDHDQPTTRYEITDGTQPVGVTERINESRTRYWRATSNSGAVRDFPYGRHNDGAMPWLRGTP
jgi:hypothetical protein